MINITKPIKGNGYKLEVSSIESNNTYLDNQIDFSNCLTILKRNSIYTNNNLIKIQIEIDREYQSSQNEYIVYDTIIDVHINSSFSSSCFF